MLGLQGGKLHSVNHVRFTVIHLNTHRQQSYLPPTASSCGWAPAVFLCERRSDPPGLLLGRLDIGTSLLKGHTLSRHYHSLKDKRGRAMRHVAWRLTATPAEASVKCYCLSKNWRQNLSNNFELKDTRTKLFSRTFRTLIQSNKVLVYIAYRWSTGLNDLWRSLSTQTANSSDFVMTRFLSSRLL